LVLTDQTKGAAGGITFGAGMPEGIVATVVAGFETPAVVGETFNDEHGIRAAGFTLVAVKPLLLICADLFGIALQVDADS
jgi:hypothetical protein|tara:strand:- start:724 stop:963 length:240 start_codon:yes stop_codon:yes gene_type:complete